MDNHIASKNTLSASILPSPKGLVLTAINLCQQEQVSPAELARVIQGDPVLTARIIKLANDSNQNKTRQIASVTADTLVLIGINEVRQEILSISLENNYRNSPCKSFDFYGFWAHSVGVACTAQVLGSALKLGPDHEMFACGLLSGIGHLALASQFPKDYASYSSDQAQTLTDENKLFGTSQREILQQLLTGMGFPRLYAEALFHRYDPDAVTTKENARVRQMAYMLHLSDLLAYTVTSQTQNNQKPGPEITAEIERTAHKLSMSPELLTSFEAAAANEWLDWGSMLGLSSVKTKNNGNPASHVLHPHTSETLPASPMLPLAILLAGSDWPRILMLKGMLEKSGHTVMTANNGKTALATVIEKNPQVVIADWVMPQLDGLNLCREIRKLPKGERIYFLMLTQFEDERRQVEAYTAGVNNLLREPYNINTFQAHLLAVERFVRLTIKSK